MIIPSGRRGLPEVIALAAAAGGAIVAFHYARLGLTLTHYDARGHLVVSRRIFDSITPGWQQIGAVWLPLPHLLNAIPAQVDFFYRTGASAVAISVAAFAIASGSIAAIVVTITDSAAAAIAGAAVFALNPNVLYLQSTPMTEPLLLALTTSALAVLLQSAKRQSVGNLHSEWSDAAGVLFALACLTRYEAWPVTVTALAAAWWGWWRHGEDPSTAARRMFSIARYPILAIVSFAVFSRVVIGEWFVQSGFFVPENKAIGDPMLAAAEVGWGVRTLSGMALVTVGSVGAGILAALGLSSRKRAASLIPLSLLTMAVPPWLAFIDGHPFRIRYTAPLLAMEAIGAGIAAGAIRRLRLASAIALFALVAYELRPLDAAAPMVTEAQWDRPNLQARAAVTACLGQPGSGEKIMASMGSLGHYMQEASNAGFAVRDFLHEGNGDIWLAALNDGPRLFAKWVLIEEKAEGGDMLAKIARERPVFLDGYSRVCEGAGLALYRRRDQPWRSVRSGNSP